MSNLNFGQAVEAMKQGKMVSRQGWNGKNMFVFMQIPATIEKEIVPKMQSLPELVKKEFEKRFNDESLQVSAINYSNQMAIVNSSNLICGWSPSTTDALSEDWTIYE